MCCPRYRVRAVLADIPNVEQLATRVVNSGHGAFAPPSLMKIVIERDRFWS
jgi:hypothetical protein